MTRFRLVSGHAGECGVKNSALIIMRCTRHSLSNSILAILS